MLAINICAGVEADYKLAEAIKESQIFGILLSKNNSNIPLVMAALAYKNTLTRLTIDFFPNPEEYECIANMIQSNEHLERFYVFDEDMAGEFITSLIPALSSHKALKEVHFTSHGHQEGYRSISRILSQNTSIRSLSLCTPHEYDVTIDDMTTLCTALAMNKTLEHIYLVNLLPAATQILFSSLAENQLNLAKLSILETDISEDNINALVESAKTNTRLADIAFMDCRFNEHKCQLLFRGLKQSQNKYLTSIMIRHSTLGVVGVEAICDLVNVGFMKKLELKSNQIDAEQCKLIARALSNNKSLTELSLIGNMFGDEGLMSICQAMLSNTTLRTLQLEYVNYGVDGVTGVKDMLMHNTTLRSLSVQFNHQSLDLICEGLKHNDTLTCFKGSPLGFPNYGETLVQQMTEALQHNYALDDIDVSVATMNNAFRTLLQRNRQLKSGVKYKVAVLSHNVARSNHALKTFPREIWIHILSLITHPGMDGLGLLVHDIFTQHSLTK